MRNFTEMIIVCQVHFFPILAMLIESARVQKALSLSNTQFKRLFGVKKATFNKMLTILQVAYEQLHARGGKGLENGANITNPVKIDNTNGNGTLPFIERQRQLSKVCATLGQELRGG